MATSVSLLSPHALGSCSPPSIRNRWLSYLINNHYQDSSIQKVFMPTTPGCVKNHLKLAAILAEVKKKHKSYTVCWLMLTGLWTIHLSSMYSSTSPVPRLSIPDFPLFCQVLEALYSELSAQVITRDWATPVISPFRLVYTKVIHCQ